MTLGGALDSNSELDDLETALDACLAVPLSGLSDEELSDRLARLPSLTAKLDAVRVAAVSAGMARDVGRLSDQRSVAIATLR